MLTYGCRYRAEAPAPTPPSTQVERKDTAPPHHIKGPLGNIFSAARHLHAQRPKPGDAFFFLGDPLRMLTYADVCCRMLTYADVADVH